jgi:tetratricopeptide (TPR) repeat protein
MLSARTFRFRRIACCLLTIAAGLPMVPRAWAQEDSEIATTEGEPTEGQLTPEAPAEGQPAEGQQQYTEEQVQELIQRGEEQLKEKNFDEALATYDELNRALRQIGPQLNYQAQVLLPSMANTGRAKALAGLQEFTAAEEDFAKVLTEQPEFLPALIGRGQMYLEMNSPDQALTDFEQAVKLSRTNIEAQFGLGKSHALLGNYQAAVGPLTKTIEAQPENNEAYRLRGQANAGLLKVEAAIRDLQQAISLNPADYESYFTLGIISLRAENYEQAVAAIGKAIETYTPKPGQEDLPFLQGYLTRASMFLELGKATKDNEAARKAAYQGAIDEADTLLAQLDPNNPALAGARAAALHSRGIGERMLGQLGRAIQTFSEAIQLNPEMAEAYYRRGICFHLIGEDRMAISDFAESAHINYSDPRANLWEGYTYAKLGEYHEALRAYGNAIAASDRYAPAYMNRALAYMALGENEKAVEDLDEAIRLEPANADFYFKRGVAYERLGNNEKADVSFSSALEFNKNHQAAHRHLADVKQALGDTAAATKHRQRANELAPPQRTP